MQAVTQWRRRAIMQFEILVTSVQLFISQGYPRSVEIIWLFDTLILRRFGYAAS